MKQSKLSREAIDEKLADLRKWRLSEDERGIRRELAFGNFVEAFSFMTQCAFAAEKLNHHPEWSNVYRRVDIYLTTHDVNGLSDLDFKLAAMFDRIADRFDGSGD